MGAQYGAVEGNGGYSAPASTLVGHGSVPSPGVAQGGVNVQDAENIRLLVAGTIKSKDNSNEGIFGRNSRRSDNSRLVTILLVLNYMIGSGILNAPQTFRDSGVAATTVLYLLACEYMYFFRCFVFEFCFQNFNTSKNRRAYTSPTQ